MKFGLAAIAVIADLLALWRSHDLSWRDRIFIAVVCFTTVLFLWPPDLSFCRYSLWYLVLGGAFLVWGWLAWARAAELVDRFGHHRPTWEGGDASVDTIIGGPVLSEDATKLKSADPNLSIEDLLKELGWDPRLTWERKSRSKITKLHWFWATSRTVALTLAPVCALAWVLLVAGGGRMHIKLTITPPPDPALTAGKALLIKWNHTACHPGIKWHVEGSGDVGNVSPSGNYSSPMKIDKESDVVVVAVPDDDSNEVQSLKLTLKPKYEGVDESRIIAQDPQGNAAAFVFMINKRHSWRLGHVEIEGVSDPGGMVRSMAVGGLFSGFQDILCVGAASHEYLPDCEEMEERRAMDRANLLGWWVTQASKRDGARLWTMSIGRNNSEDKTRRDTSIERQVVVVGVKWADKKVNLKEALLDAFRKQRSTDELFGMYVDHYPYDHWKLSAAPTAAPTLSTVVGPALSQPAPCP
jgi:hypothetical protein